MDTQDKSFLSPESIAKEITLAVFWGIRRGRGISADPSRNSLFQHERCKIYEFLGPRSLGVGGWCSELRCFGAVMR